MGTKFTEVYNCFLGKITDDMYMELTPADTVRDLQHLLTCAIPGFEFPRVQLNDYKIDVKRKWQHDLNPDDFVIGYIWNDLETDDMTDQPESQMAIVDNSEFAATLSHEEMNILAILMMEGWLHRQITSIENIRMKYSGSDFKLTSQANHLSKLLNLLSEVQRQAHHLQRLYKRRRTCKESGLIESNWDVLRFGTYNSQIIQGKKLSELLKDYALKSELAHMEELPEDDTDEI